MFTTHFYEQVHNHFMQINTESLPKELIPILHNKNVQNDTSTIDEGLAKCLTLYMKMQSVSSQSESIARLAERTRIRIKQPKEQQFASQWISDQTLIIALLVCILLWLLQDYVWSRTISIAMGPPS